MRTQLLCVALLAACGGGSSDGGHDGDVGDANPGDGRDTDAAGDASPDAAPATARVQAVSTDGPVSGVKVAFLDASNATVAVVTTGADGIADGPMPATGSIVAASPAGDRALLWKSVKEGDVLVARFAPTSAPHTVTVMMPSTGTGLSYRVSSRCGKSAYVQSLSVPLTVPTDCTVSDLFLQRSDGVGLTPAELFVPAQDLTAATIDLSAQSWVGTTSYSVTGSGVTASSAELDTATRVGSVFVTGNGTAVARTQGMPVGTIATQGVTIPATGLETVTALSTMSGTVKLTSLRRGGLPVPAFDGGSRVVTVAGPIHNAGTHTFTWFQGSVGDPIDAIEGTLVFDRSGLPQLTWEIASPAVAGTSIVLPTLPPELSSVDPGTTTASSARVRGYAVANGYEQLRAPMLGTVEPDELLPAAGGLLRMADSDPN